eukprot:g82728.t1
MSPPNPRSSRSHPEKSLQNARQEKIWRLVPLCHDCKKKGASQLKTVCNLKLAVECSIRHGRTMSYYSLSIGSRGSKRRAVPSSSPQHYLRDATELCGRVSMLLLCLGVLLAVTTTAGFWTARKYKEWKHKKPESLAECEGITSDRAGLLAAAIWIAEKPVTYSQAMDKRWSGIDKHICPGDKHMFYADCSSLVTWVYWTAFGKGPDFVNAKNWKAGTVDFESHLISLSQAVPGDIFLHGKPIRHVTMYMGNGKVLSHGSTKHPPRIQDMCAGFGCPVKVIQHLPPEMPTAPEPTKQPTKPVKAPKTKTPKAKKPKRPISQTPKGKAVPFLLYVVLLSMLISLGGYLFQLGVPQLLWSYSQLMWSYCCGLFTDSCCAGNSDGPTPDQDWEYISQLYSGPDGSYYEFGAGATKSGTLGQYLCLDSCFGCCSSSSASVYDTYAGDDSRSCVDMVKAAAASCCCCCSDGQQGDDPYDFSKPADIDYQLLEMEIGKLLQEACGGDDRRKRKRKDPDSRKRKYNKPAQIDYHQLDLELAQLLEEARGGDNRAKGEDPYDKEEEEKKEKDEGEVKEVEEEKEEKGNEKQKETDHHLLEMEVGDLLLLQEALCARDGQNGEDPHYVDKPAEIQAVSKPAEIQAISKAEMQAVNKPAEIDFHLLDMELAQLLQEARGGGTTFSPALSSEPFFFFSQFACYKLFECLNPDRLEIHKHPEGRGRELSSGEDVHLYQCHRFGPKNPRGFYKVAPKPEYFQWILRTHKRHETVKSNTLFVRASSCKVCEGVERASTYKSAWRRSNYVQYVGAFSTTGTVVFSGDCGDEQTIAGTVRRLWGGAKSWNRRGSHSQGKYQILFPSCFEILHDSYRCGGEATEVVHLQYDDILSRVEYSVSNPSSTDALDFVFVSTRLVPYVTTSSDKANILATSRRISNGAITQQVAAVLLNETQYPWLRSTEMYPEWGFISLPRVPLTVRQLVQSALLSFDNGHAGFRPPADYSQVPNACTGQAKNYVSFVELIGGFGTVPGGSPWHRRVPKGLPTQRICSTSLRALPARLILRDRARVMPEVRYRVWYYVNASGASACLRCTEGFATQTTGSKGCYNLSTIQQNMKYDALKACALFPNKTLTIGVASAEEIALTDERWRPTFDEVINNYMNRFDCYFRMEALTLPKLKVALQAGKIDFFYMDSGVYTLFKHSHRARALGHIQEAGAIYRKKGSNDDLFTLEQVQAAGMTRNLTLCPVAAIAFSGNQAQRPGFFSAVAGSAQCQACPTGYSSSFGASFCREVKDVLAYRPIEACALFPNKTLVVVVAREGAALEVLLAQWRPTFEEVLNDYFSRYQCFFRMLSLSNEEVPEAVKSKSVDFLFSSSGLFVEQELSQGLKALSTVLRIFNGHVSITYGEVMFAKYGEHDAELASLQDVAKTGATRSLRACAPTKDSFGGWQANWFEFFSQGLDVEAIFSSIDFVGSHQEVVWMVHSGQCDVGMVRTRTLEEVITAGKYQVSCATFLSFPNRHKLLQFEDFFIINKQSHEGFSELCSTRTYPEWPLSVLPHVPEEIASVISIPLLALRVIPPFRLPPSFTFPEWDQASIAASHSGFTPALPYDSVANVRYQLNLEPLSSCGPGSTRDETAALLRSVPSRGLECASSAARVGTVLPPAVWNACLVYFGTTTHVPGSTQCTPYVEHLELSKQAAIAVFLAGTSVILGIDFIVDPPFYVSNMLQLSGQGYYTMLEACHISKDTGSATNTVNTNQYAVQSLKDKSGVDFDTIHGKANPGARSRLQQLDNMPSAAMNSRLKSSKVHSNDTGSVISVCDSDLEHEMLPHDMVIEFVPDSDIEGDAELREVVPRAQLDDVFGLMGLTLFTSGEPANGKRASHVSASWHPSSQATRTSHKSHPSGSTQHPAWSSPDPSGRTEHPASGRPHPSKAQDA